MTIASAVTGIEVFIGGVLALGLGRKLFVLTRGDAASEPLLARETRRRHARTLLALAALVELATIVLLVAEPAVGLIVAAALLGVYAWELRRLEPSQPCNCLPLAGGGAGRNTAIARNVVLIAIALAAAGLAHLDGSTPQPAAAIGLASLGFALLLGEEVAHRFDRDHPVRVSRPSPGGPR